MSRIGKKPVTVPGSVTAAVNGQEVKVKGPKGELKHVLDVLAEEGYIRGYARVDYSGGKSEFEIELKYFDGEPVIKDIKRVSTPKGVMSDSRARTENVGGEILCSIF